MKPYKIKELVKCGGSDKAVLERFMKEFFPFDELYQAGFFTREMVNDYYAQAKRVCDYFGYESVFEYGAKEIYCHISYNGERPEKEESFITKIKNIYE